MFSLHIQSFQEVSPSKVLNFLPFQICLDSNNVPFSSFNLRCICIGSLKALLIFYLITYSWSFIPGHVIMKDNSTATNAGCDTSRFSWCTDLSPINVNIYYFLYVLIIGIAFPTLNVALFTVFSTILGPRRQGTMQGVFQISGGMARMLGSFALGNLYIMYGPKLTWTLVIAVLGITTTGWILFYRKMVPLKLVRQ